MNLKEIRKMATELEINCGRKNKAQIVQAIQIKENNFPCYKTASEYCDQQECLWREDCIEHP